MKLIDPLIVAPLFNYDQSSRIQTLLQSRSVRFILVPQPFIINFLLRLLQIIANTIIKALVIVKLQLTMLD